MQKLEKAKSLGTAEISCGYKKYMGKRVAWQPSSIIVSLAVMLITTAESNGEFKVQKGLCRTVAKDALSPKLYNDLYCWLSESWSKSKPTAEQMKCTCIVLTSFCSLSMSMSYSSFFLFNSSSSFRHLYRK